MEINCPNCSQTLRVGDGDAGKNARCPKCQTVFAIENSGGAAGPANTPAGNNDPYGGAADPYGNSGSSPGPGAAPPSPAPSAPQGGAAGQEMWHLKIDDGRTFGPVTKSELDSWLGENRITANSHLRRDHESNWLPAYAIYPQLGSPQPQGQNPFADQQAYGAKPAGAYNMGQGGYREPHRGVTILLLGIFGFFCCCFLSIAAVAMGHSDLKKIDSGQMDPDGRGLTMAGYIIGIIGLILNALGAVLQIVLAAAGEM